jgi:hypothetical protein
MSRLRILLAAILVSAAAAGLWHWQGVRKAEARARRDVWMAYLQGPLSDLLYGSSRLRPLLAKKNWSSADTASAKEALGHLQRSADEARAESELFAKDERLRPLADAVSLHQKMAASMLEGVEKRSAWKDLLASDAEIRLQLWTLLAAQRERMLSEKSLSQDQVLEMNALLYSLHEETASSPEVL